MTETSASSSKAMRRHGTILAISFAGWMAAAILQSDFARAEDPSAGKDDSARVAAEQLFREQIRPILTAHCRGCHNAGKSHGSLDLESQFTAPGLTESSERVAEVPFAENELWRRVTANDPMERMPLDAPPLSEAELAAIRQWAEAGAPWPVAPEPPRVRVEQSFPTPWWVRLLMPLDAASRYVEQFSAYRSAAYAALVLLCFAAAGELSKRAVRRHGELAKPWQRLLGRVVNGTFYKAGFTVVVAWVVWLYIQQLIKNADGLENQVKLLHEQIAHERQQQSTTSTGEPAAFYLPQPPRLGGAYYRGNDERSDQLFNGGRYRTCTFTVSLCDAQRKPLTAGDAVPPGPLLVRLEIERAPFATKALFSKKVIGATFASPLKPHEKITDRANQIIRFDTVVNGDRWEAFIPIADMQSATETKKLAGTLYLYNGGKYEEQLEGSPSYTIRYELNLADGKLAPDSDMRMGVAIIPGGFAVPPPGHDSITDWFDVRPIPEIVGGNTSDPTLLGIKPHEQRLGTPLKADDDEKKSDDDEKK